MNMLPLNNKLKSRYFSVYIRFLLALTASVYIILEGQQRSIFKILQQKNFYVTLVFSLIVAIILIEMIHFTSVLLDKKWGWKKQPVIRLVLQIVFGLVLVLYLDVLLIKGFFWLFNNDFEKSGYMLTEFPKVKWMVGIMNFLYWIKAMSPELLSLKHFRTNDKFYLKLASKSAQAENDNFHLTGKLDVIRAKLGNKIRFVKFDEIACLKCESLTGFVYLKDNTVFTINYKTNELTQILDNERFYQTNRGVIYSFDVIEGYRRDKKEGILILKMDIDLEVSKIISRERYMKFKAAFESYQRNRQA